MSDFDPEILIKCLDALRGTGKQSIPVKEQVEYCYTILPPEEAEMFERFSKKKAAYYDKLSDTNAKYNKDDKAVKVAIQAITKIRNQQKAAKERAAEGKPVDPLPTGDGASDVEYYGSVELPSGYIDSMVTAYRTAKDQAERDSLVAEANAYGVNLILQAHTGGARKSKRHRRHHRRKTHKHKRGKKSHKRKHNKTSRKRHKSRKHRSHH